MTAVPSGPIEVVGLDGDDTFWRNEEYFADTQEFFRASSRPTPTGSTSTPAWPPTNAGTSSCSASASRASRSR